MNEIYVPAEALKSENDFREWFISVHKQLFDKPVDLNSNRNAFPKDDQEALALVEKVMIKVNACLNNDERIPDWKVKNKKYNCKMGDIMSITVYLILSYYDVTYVRLGKILNISYSNVIYYVKKNYGYCIVRSHRLKYLHILTQLQNEGTIPYSKAKKLKSKRLLHTLQFTE